MRPMRQESRIEEDFCPLIKLILRVTQYEGVSVATDKVERPDLVVLLANPATLIIVKSVELIRFPSKQTFLDSR